MPPEYLKPTLMYYFSSAKTYPEVWNLALKRTLKYGNSDPPDTMFMIIGSRVTRLIIDLKELEVQKFAPLFLFCVNHFGL